MGGAGIGLAAPARAGDPARRRGPADGGGGVAGHGVVGGPDLVVAQHGGHRHEAAALMVAFLRNTWRGLTSMRTALVLLFLLALAALPGALLPQRSLNQRLRAQHFPH